jgi:hypothetical protein
LTFNSDSGALEYTHLFRLKNSSDNQALSIISLFAKDPNRESTFVAFGVKPSGKFYLYQNGRMYDEIKGSSQTNIGNLT